MCLFSRMRDSNRLKLLVYDGSGLWVCREEVGRRKISVAAERQRRKKIVLSHEELALLLGGIDLAQTERRKWYRKPPAEEPTESLKTA